MSEEIQHKRESRQRAISPSGSLSYTASVATEDSYRDKLSVKEKSVGARDGSRAQFMMQAFEGLPGNRPGTPNTASSSTPGTRNSEGLGRFDQSRGERSRTGSQTSRTSRLSQASRTSRLSRLDCNLAASAPNLQASSLTQLPKMSRVIQVPSEISLDINSSFPTSPIQSRARTQSFAGQDSKGSYPTSPTNLRSKSIASQNSKGTAPISPGASPRARSTSKGSQDSKASIPLNNSKSDSGNTTSPATLSQSGSTKYRGASMAISVTSLPTGNVTVTISPSDPAELSQQKKGPSQKQLLESDISLKKREKLTEMTSPVNVVTPSQPISVINKFDWEQKPTDTPGNQMPILSVYSAGDDPSIYSCSIGPSTAETRNAGVLFNDEFTVIEDDCILSSITMREIPKRVSSGDRARHSVLSVSHVTEKIGKSFSHFQEHGKNQPILPIAAARSDQIQKSIYKHPDDEDKWIEPPREKLCGDEGTFSRRFLILLFSVAVIGVAAISGAITVAVLFFSNNDLPSDSAPVVNSTPNPSSTENSIFSSGGNRIDPSDVVGETVSLLGTTRYDQIYNRVLQITPASALSSGTSSYKTAQKNALEWIVYSDPAQVPPDDIMLIERYALTTIFYALGGTQWYADGNWLSHANVCTWVRVQCEIRADRVVVTSLSLNNMNLSGGIPDELALGLPSLEELDLSRNNIRGLIPNSLAALQNLRKLNLSYTYIDGLIPSSLFGDAWRISLRVLHLNNCKLSGPLPDSLAELDSLEELHLHNNQLSGPIPFSLCAQETLQSLYSLYLGTNNFDGVLPESLGYCASLNVLRLEENKFYGNVPSTLGNLQRLKLLRLEGNELSGSMPQSICNLKGGTLSEIKVDCSVACSASCCGQCYS